jgi:signal transduction histidine kinase
VRIADAAARASELVEPQLSAKGLRLERAPLEDVPPVRADADRLTRILVNLLSNAAKFTDTGAVGVRAEVTAARVGLSVWDSGCGIAADQLERIFEPFVQAPGARGRAPGGTGLGLAIGRDLARAMGGDLVVASTPGEGSVFTVWLPRADAASAPALARATGGVLTVWPPASFAVPLRDSGVGIRDSGFEQLEGPASARGS